MPPPEDDPGVAMPPAGRGGVAPPPMGRQASAPWALPWQVAPRVAAPVGALLARPALRRGHRFRRCHCRLLRCGFFLRRGAFGCWLLRRCALRRRLAGRGLSRGRLLRRRLLARRGLFLGAGLLRARPRGARAAGGLACTRFLSRSALLPTRSRSHGSAPIVYCPQAAADSGRVHARIILTVPSLPSRATS